MSVRDMMAAAAGSVSVAPSFVASAYATYSGDLTISKPTGTIQGDLMVVVLNSGASSTWSIPSDWTVATKSAGNRPNLTIAYKIATSSEASAFTFSTSSKTNGRILTYRNAQFGFASEVVVASTGSDCVASQTHIPTNNSLLLAAFAVDSGGLSFPTPTGMTLLYTDSADSTLSIFSENPSTGFTGTRSSDVSGTSGNVHGVLFSILPSSFVPPALNYVGSQIKINSATGSTLIINKPTGTRQGDLMIAFMCSTSYFPWSGDTGWTEVVDQGSSGPGLRVAYKVAGPSESSSYSFVAAGTTSKLTGAILTYRGASYGATGSLVTYNNPLYPSAPSNLISYTRLIGFGARPGFEGVTTNMTIQRANKNDGSGPAWCIGEETVSGDTGKRSFSFGNTGGAAILLSIVLA